MHNLGGHQFESRQNLPRWYFKYFWPIQTKRLKPPISHFEAIVDIGVTKYGRKNWWGKLLKTSSLCKTRLTYHWFLVSFNLQNKLTSYGTTYFLGYNFTQMFYNNLSQTQIYKLATIVTKYVLNQPKLVVDVVIKCHDSSRSRFRIPSIFWRILMSLTLNLSENSSPPIQVRTSLTFL